MTLNLHSIAGIVLAAVVLISALLLVHVRRADNGQSALTYAGASLLGCWLIALVAPAPLGVSYKGAMVFVLTLIVLACLILESDLVPKYVAGALFLIVYAVLAVTFVAYISLHEMNAWVLVPPVLTAVAYASLHRSLREIRGAVIAYAVLFGLTGLFVLTFFLQYGAPSGVAALAGVTLVGIADLLRGQIFIANRFTALTAYTAIPSMLGYLFLAASVWTI